MPSDTVSALSLCHRVVAAVNDALTLVAYPGVACSTNAHLLAFLVAIVTPSEATLALKLGGLVMGALQDLLATIVDACPTSLACAHLPTGSGIMERMPLVAPCTVFIANGLPDFVLVTFLDWLTVSFEGNKVGLTAAHLTTGLCAIRVVSSETLIALCLGDRVPSALDDWHAHVVDPREVLLASAHLLAGGAVATHLDDLIGGALLDGHANVVDQCQSGIAHTHLLAVLGAYAGSWVAV